MTGKTLYGLYEDAMRDELNCEVEAWSDLPPGDKAVWNTMADQVRWT